MPIQVSEVLAAAAQLVGRDDLLNKIAGAQEDSEVTLLLKCYNLIENELALDDFPLKARESLSPAKGELAFSAFRKAPTEIFSVALPSGMGIPFKLFADKIEVAENVKEVVVTYAYPPAEKAKGDVCECTGKISLRLLALGVAAEYLLAHGLYAEASAFEERYREALRSAVRTTERKRRIRARRWV